MSKHALSRLAYWFWSVRACQCLLVLACFCVVVACFWLVFSIVVACVSFVLLVCSLDVGCFSLCFACICVLWPICFLFCFLRVCFLFACVYLLFSIAFGFHCLDFARVCSYRMPYFWDIWQKLQLRISRVLSCLLQKIFQIRPSISEPLIQKSFRFSANASVFLVNIIRFLACHFR